MTSVPCRSWLFLRLMLGNAIFLSCFPSAFSHSLKKSIKLKVVLIMSIINMNCLLPFKGSSLEDQLTLWHFVVQWRSWMPQHLNMSFKIYLLHHSLCLIYMYLWYYTRAINALFRMSGAWNFMIRPSTSKLLCLVHYWAGKLFFFLLWDNTIRHSSSAHKIRLLKMGSFLHFWRGAGFFRF